MGADWSPDLMLNDGLLDRQHVDLFRKLEEAGAAIDGPRETLDAAVGAVAEALMDHIAAEERLMEETLYPERVRHKSAHELFVADFERMRSELRAKGPTPTVADWVRHRIPEWLSFHIRVNDQPLAAWLARWRAADGTVRARKDDGRRFS